MPAKCIEEFVARKMQILPAYLKQVATAPTFIGIRPQALVDPQDHSVAVHRGSSSQLHLWSCPMAEQNPRHAAKILWPLNLAADGIRRARSTAHGHVQRSRRRLHAFVGTRRLQFLPAERPRSAPDV